MTFDAQTNNIWQGRPLASFFDNHKGCRIIRKDRNKILLKVQTVVTGKSGLFVKIYMCPTWWKRIKAHLQLSQGLHDLRICQQLQSLGVPVPAPVGALEEQARFGYPKRSLYACQWIENATSLQNMVVEMYLKRTGERELLHKLNVATGYFIAELHRKGVIPADLNSGNLLVKQSGSDKESFEFLLIDYERIFFSKTILPKQRLANLVQIAAFMLPSAEKAPWSLCLGYTQVHKEFDKEILAIKVNELARKRRAYWKRQVDERFRNIAKNMKKSSR